MHQNNQRIANLHYVLDELDKLYTEIHNGVITNPHQTRKQLIESYRKQRSQFMDMLSFILPPISSPNASLITATSASMFPSCIDHTDNHIHSNINNKPPLIGTEPNTESNTFVASAFQNTQQNLSIQSHPNHMMDLNEPGMNTHQVITPNQWGANTNGTHTTPPPLVHREPLNRIASPNHLNSNSIYSEMNTVNTMNVNIVNTMHGQNPNDIHSNTNTNSHSTNTTVSSYASNVMSHYAQYEYSEESEQEYGQNNDDYTNGYRNNETLNEYHDYGYDEEDNKHNELEPGQQLMTAQKPVIAVTLSIADLDEKCIESNKKKVTSRAAKREKTIRQQIGHLLKFYKCGIDENVFIAAHYNYFGYKLEMRHLPKCASWNEFMLRCTWRKQLRRGTNAYGYIYSKYKSQYPHVYGLKKTGNSFLNDTDDVLSLIDLMLDSFECGVLKHHICEVFQVFYGKRLQFEGQQKEIERYLDAHFNDAHLYTFCGNIQIMDKVYISSDRASALKQWMMTTLRKELLQLFFYRSPSGILESELPYVYRQTFKCAMCLLHMCLSEFISSHMSEYIECIQTQQRKTLYYFRSYLGLAHTVNKLLKCVDLDTRCAWIRDKVTAIMSLYKHGIEWQCLVKAVLSIASFQLSQSLFTVEEFPPSCIQLLQQHIPDLMVEMQDNMKICSLRSMRASNRKKKANIAPVIDRQMVYSYYDLVVNILNKTKDNEDDKGLFIDEMESKFNQKYDKFRLIIETPLVLCQIRSRIDEQIYGEYKRFKYNPYTSTSYYASSTSDSARGKHWRHSNAYRINTYKRVKEPDPYDRDDEKKMYATKWRQKEKKTEDKPKTNIKTNAKKEDHIKETIFNSSNNYLHIDDICIICGMDNNKELNGISVKLMKYLRDTSSKSKWKVMMTTSAKAGTFREIPSDNLRRIVDTNMNSTSAFNKLNRIKPDATKVAIINLSKSTKKSHVIYKLEKTYGVGVVYCSDIIDDPYKSKANFIAKLELQNAQQISYLVDAQHHETLFMDKQKIRVHPYAYKYTKYKDILMQMVQITVDETKHKNKKLSIADLYKMYKEIKFDFEEKKKLSLIELCQLLEHDRTKVYIEKNMIRTVEDEKAIRNDKIAKMVIHIFDRNAHIIANQWTTRTFKRKWAQEYNTNLNDAVFGKYRSYVHFLNDIQSKYQINIMHNRKKSESSSIKFRVSLK